MQRLLRILLRKNVINQNDIAYVTGYKTTETQETDKIVCYCDGGCLGNPGEMYHSREIRLVRHSGKDTHLVLDKIKKEPLGHGTNNVAEYMALIETMKSLLNMILDDVDLLSIQIWTDSQVVVSQVLGEFKVKADNLKPLHKEATSLLESLKTFGEVSLSYLSRDEIEKVLGH